MSFSPMAPTVLRSGVQDFSHPYFFEYTTLVYKKPDQNNKMNVYASPFKLTVGD